MSTAALAGMATPLVSSLPASLSSLSTLYNAAMSGLPQQNLNTNYAGQGPTVTPNPYTQAAQPSWMTGNYAMPSWGTDAVTGQPLTQENLQYQEPAAEETAKRNRLIDWDKILGNVSGNVGNISKNVGNIGTNLGNVGSKIGGLASALSGDSGDESTGTDTLSYEEWLQSPFATLYRGSAQIGADGTLDMYTAYQAYLADAAKKDAGQHSGTMNALNVGQALYDTTQSYSEDDTGSKGLASYLPSSSKFSSA